MRTIHIVTHTHWDREWYLTFQQFRLRLVHLIDGLLDLLDKDERYRNFMLDGQTIVLDDYLDVRPEREAELRWRIQEGRITIGPWHILPDEFLVSPEATIRNLLQGERTARKFGPKMQVGYIPDPFGHIGQMPQILRGFGIHSACVQRGLSDEPCEFWWQAPDGSRVFMAYLRDGYGNAADLPPADPARFSAEVRRLRDALAPHTSAGHLLLMWGIDHMEPSPATSQAIAAVQGSLDGDVLVHSSLADFIQAVQLSVDPEKLQVVHGELRSPKRHPLLPNVLSTRMWIKQRNRACETLLEKWAEPFSVWAELTRAEEPPPGHLRNPAALLHKAWRMLMENHPHDSICGCSIDPVHAEMRTRFDQVDQFAERIVGQSLEAIAGEVETIDDRPQTTDNGGRTTEAAVVVFNPLGTRRTDGVELTLELPAGSGALALVDEKGTELPIQTGGLGSRDLVSMTLGRNEFKRMVGMAFEGNVAGLVLRDISIHRAGSQAAIHVTLSDRGAPDMNAWQRGIKEIAALLEDAAVTTYAVRARSVAATRLSFAAADVPGHGWRTFWVRSRPAGLSAPLRLNPLAQALLPVGARLAQNVFVQKTIARLTPDPRRKPPFRIENEYFSLECAADGTLTLSDKRSGAAYPGLNRFVDGADCGDEYNYAPPEHDALITAKLKGVRVERGAVMQTLELSLELAIPEALAPNRKSRAGSTVRLQITSRATLINGVERVDIRTEVVNPGRDHRLRVHFPAPFSAAQAWHDGHFEVVQRPLGVPAFDESWVEQPRPEVPQRAFTDIDDGRLGLAVANRGLPEVEVLKRADGRAEIALTLLRCVGWLSRDDFSTRKGHAGPPSLAVPEAQMPGAWSFEYALIPHLAGQRLSAWHEAYAFEAPLQAVSAGLHAGSLPTQGAFITVAPTEFVVSAVKQAEDGRGWLVRGYNLEGKEIEARIRPWRRFASVERVNLAEERLGALEPAENGSVTFPVRGHEIVSFIFMA